MSGWKALAAGEEPYLLNFIASSNYYDIKQTKNPNTRARLGL